MKGSGGNAGPASPPQPVTFSVLIGLASTEDGGRILETLDALRRQEGGYAYEVLIGDRRQDEVSRTIVANYPEASLIPCPARTSLPQLRTAALDRASGNYVIVTEDHCVPSRNWLDSIARAFREAPPGTAAVGGCVENGVRDTPLDWATFFCEYGAFLAPVCEGECSVLPGMNVAYERSALRAFDRPLLEGGFWEMTLHPGLRKSGAALYSTRDIEILHCKKFSFGLFVRQRFLYSRHYAGTRFVRGNRLGRWTAFAATPILPALLLLRMIRQVLSKNRLHSEFLTALPLLALFATIGACGEMVGYARGPGDSLERIE